MKKTVFILVLIISGVLFCFCKKKVPTPTGKITFWSDVTNEWCGQVGNPKIIYISIDGKNVGQVSNYQSVAPSSCVQSNTLLIVEVAQGAHTISFTQNCNNHTWSDKINLSSGCFVYEVTY
jgi:hypothetical protein